MHFKVFVAVALLFYANLSGARDIEHRIVLKNGQGVRTITDRIPTPDDVVAYELSAKAGQQIVIRLEPRGKLVALALLVLPSGVQEGPGADLAHVVHETGTFHIRVVPRERTSGSFRLYLSLH